MKLGQALLGEDTCFVIMDEKICRILFPGETPEETSLERDRLADEIAEKVVLWIESGVGFSYPFHSEENPFHRNVYQAVQKIPKGKVSTYKAVAEKIGTRAYRAVGQALGRNPVPLLVPCHRVVGSDRGLTGFGGGIELKRKILEAEGVEFEEGKVKKEYILEHL
jgi:methylated-DNA-[protein]-cysteine S-methyltransferase